MLVGGIDTHRHDLSSMIMLKDNHIWSSGKHFKDRNVTLSDYSKDPLRQLSNRLDLLADSH